jgi:hypothetical protein
MLHPPQALEAYREMTSIRHEENSNRVGVFYKYFFIKSIEGATDD